MEPVKDNCLNIGRDDITTPALFVHAPRAPERGEELYGNQCHFGGRAPVAHDCINIAVYRNSEADQAYLLIDTHTNHCCVSDRYKMTANEMQALACALLDCAHHLRTVPAMPYAAPVADEVAA